MKKKSVQSVHPCESVIQTILKAHIGEIVVNTDQNGSEFVIKLPHS